MARRKPRTPRTHDLGLGFILTEYLVDGELVGYTVTGPAAASCRSSYRKRCGGLCAVRPFSVPLGEKATRTYSVWAAGGEWPNITLAPSVQCDCSGQHGFVRDGRYVNAGGIIS